MMNGKRRFIRVPVSVGCTVQTKQEAFSTKVLQLSEGGALLQVAFDYPLPERFGLTFQLAVARPIVVEVEPRYRRARGAYRPDPELPAVGVRFLNLPTVGQRAVAEYVAAQQQALKQLQFSLALTPPPPKANELLRRIGLADTPLAQLKELVRWVYQPA